MARYLTINGSPHVQGRCGAIVTQVEQALGASLSQGSCERVDVAACTIAGCTGCESCREKGICVFDDDMTAVRTALDKASGLVVVSPVYFAGPPSQFKALLDRLQPYYHERMRARDGGHLPAQRPAALIVVGDGGDPHGFDPLVGICKSALAVAGFGLESVQACVGARCDTDAAVKATCEALKRPAE